VVRAARLHRAERPQRAVHAVKVPETDSVVVAARDQPRAGRVQGQGRHGARVVLQHDVVGRGQAPRGRCWCGALVVVVVVIALVLVVVVVVVVVVLAIVVIDAAPVGWIGAIVVLLRVLVALSSVLLGSIRLVLGPFALCCTFACFPPNGHVKTRLRSWCAFTGRRRLLAKVQRVHAARAKLAAHERARHGLDLGTSLFGSTHVSQGTALFEIMVPTWFIPFCKRHVHSLSLTSSSSPPLPSSFSLWSRRRTGCWPATLEHDEQQQHPAVDDDAARNKQHVQPAAAPVVGLGRGHGPAHDAVLTDTARAGDTAVNNVICATAAVQPQQQPHVHRRGRAADNGQGRTADRVERAAAQAHPRRGTRFTPPPALVLTTSEGK